ncbi:MAG: radical SAM protein [Patescibacteria group bacterium]
MIKHLKVLLVYPPNQLMSIETPRPDGSLGPLYLAGALELAGFETDILDASVGTMEDRLEDTFYKSIMQPNGLVRIGMSIGRIKEVVANGDYDVVGISSNFTPQTRMALEVASAVKQINPSILVIAGGVNARNMPRRFLDSGNVDVICMTESEKIIVRLLSNLALGHDFSGVPGITHKKDGQYVKNAYGQDDYYSKLDGLPMPAWHKLPFVHYDRIASPHSVIPSIGTRYAPIMTSRGCPFRCTYCHISMEKDDDENGTGALRLKSVGRVMEEIAILRSLGVKKLYFEDDSLLAKKARVKTIFGQLTGMGLEIADVNGVNLAHFQKRGADGKMEPDIEYLELLKSSGFNQIVFPVESGSQRILDKYATAKLNLQTFDVVDLMRTASSIGITCPVNMMIGFPDETEAEMMQSVELGRRLVEAGAAYCTFFIPIPFPGSKLFEMAIQGGHLDRDFDPDAMNWKNAVMQNTVVAPERILELRDWAWRSVNTEEHVAMRLKASIGNRWRGNED